MQCESICSEYRKPSLCGKSVIGGSFQNDVSLRAQAALVKTLKKEGFTKYNLDIRPINTNGGNYMGELYAIDVTGATEEGEKEVNIFMKKIIGGDNMVLLDVGAAHNRELFFYKELNKIFKELQDEAAVPGNERYRVPKSFSAKDPDVIVLENIAKKSYTTHDRMDVVTLEFAELCMEQLAKFHALSFVLEKKRPDYYNSNIKTMKSLYLLDRSGWDVFLRKISESLLKILNDEQKRRLKQFVPQLKDIIKKYVMDTDSVKCCVCHGDFRPNNIMMKKTNNGRYTDVIPIDYQIMHYACPINDVLFYITVCTDKQFRRQHMFYLKDFYFQHVTKFLKHFDIDMETVYPKEQFDRDFKARLSYGLVITFYMAPFLFAPGDDLPDFEKDINELNFKLVEDCKDRVRDLIDDFIEWGGL